MKNVRIGDIELRKTKSLKDEYWEIVKWYPNHLYGKQDEYIEVEPDNFQNKEHPNWYVGGKTIFEHPQSCYTIYIVKENKKSEPDLCSVGRRPYVIEGDDLDSLCMIIDCLYLQYDKENEN